MKKKIQHSFSGNVLDFQYPEKWEELTDEQLLYVAFLMSRFTAPAAVKTYVFTRFAGIRVHNKSKRGWFCSVRHGMFKKIRFMIAPWQVLSLIHKLDWLDELPSVPVRPAIVANYTAIDAELHGLSFRDYLICENHYQGYLFTLQMVHLEKMMPLLYTEKRYLFFNTLRSHRWKKSELVAVFLWWMSAKNHFAHQFPHFFQPMGELEQTNLNLVGQMNIQVRALTGGDITKEDKVMSMDCWRALTELDAKARDYEEMKKQQKQK